MATEERFWTRRLRWRFRGAWQWPVFALLTLLDGVILNQLPPARTGVDLVPGVIVASFVNLFLVGAVAPWITRRVVARDPGGLPREIVLDRTATALLALGLLGVVSAGLAARPAVIAETDDLEATARLVRDYVEASGSRELQRNLETANTIRLGEGLFRTCIAPDDRRGAFCLIVDTGREPPTLREDPSRSPNSELTGDGRQ